MINPLMIAAAKSGQTILLKSSWQKFNQFTLRVALRGIVCYFHTFENNLGIKQKFTKYL